MTDKEHQSTSGEVIIKGEIHTSRGDFEEERDLLVEGVDALVIEGQREQAEFGWLHGWFGVAMFIFEYLFARFLYTDHQTLVDIAEGQGAGVKFTRESNADILRNSHSLVVALAFALFYLLILLSVIFGLVMESQIYGAASLLGSGLAPLLLLRIHETVKTDNNRDEKIADTIAEAANPDDRVVAVMGRQHAKNVPEYLPEDIDSETRSPEYGVLSPSMIRDLALPTIGLCGTLAVVYPVFLTTAKFGLSLVG